MKKYYLLSFALGVLLAGFIAAPVLLINLTLVAGVFWLVADVARGFRRSRLTHAINTLPANVGSSKHTRRYRASAALATRYVFVKAGADDEHIAAIAATSDRPLGVITDEAAAAEDPIDVELAGINGRTLPCVASAAIATLNLDMYIDAVGKVMIKPTAAGTYWKVGRNLTLAAAANDPVEVQACEPRKLIVIAALTSTDGTAAGASASLPNLAAEAEKIGDDVRAIAAALNGNADVALATT